MYIPADAEVFTAKDRKVAIIYRRLPEDVRWDKWGFTIHEGDLYTVIINADISLPTQHKVLGHELAHIFCNHFERKDLDRDSKEEEANQKAWEYYKAYKAGKL